MKDKGQNTLQAFFVGVAAIAVTLLMSNGEWDIFDFIISFLIVGVGIIYFEINDIEINSWKLIFFVAIAFGIVTTAALSVLVSFYAAVFQSTWAASIDMQTYRLVVNQSTDVIIRDKVYAKQLCGQFGLFIFSFIGWLLYFLKRR